MPSQFLTDYKIKDNLELFFVEVNIWKKKWLLSLSCNPHKSNISNHTPSEERSRCIPKRVQIEDTVDIDKEC